MKSGIVLCLAIILALHSSADATSRKVLQTKRAQRAPEPIANYSSPLAFVTANGNTGQNFTIFYQALEAAGLLDFAANTSNFVDNTIFIPNDEAFARLFLERNTTADRLLADTNSLTLLLTYHIAPIGARIVGDFARYPGEYWINAMADIFVSAMLKDDGQLYLWDQVGRMARVVEPNILASGAMIHVIDNVLLPIAPNTIVQLLTNAHNDTASTFLSLLPQAPSILAVASDPTANVTVLVPTDEAFWASMAGNYTTEADLQEERLTEIFLAHTIAGGLWLEDLWGMGGSSIPTLHPNASIYINRTQHDLLLQGEGAIAGWVAKITLPDMLGNRAGSVVHFIDTVLVPYAEPEAVKKPVREATEFASFYDMLSARSEFSILKTVIDLLNYTDFTSGPMDGLTVFAPTDAAFLDLETELNTTLTALTADPAQLERVLLNHVWAVGGQAVYSHDAPYSPGARVEDETGYVVVKRDDLGVVYVSDNAGRVATVVDPDYPIGGAVAHVVDKVLLPYNSTNLLDVLLTFHSSEEDPYGAASFIGAVSLLPDLYATALDPTVNITVLVPANYAFAHALEQGFIPADLNITEADGMAILSSHVLAGGQSLYSWQDGDVLHTSVENATLTYVDYFGLPVLAGAGALEGQYGVVLINDIAGTPAGSVIHVIDWVFIPDVPAADTTADPAVARRRALESLATRKERMLLTFRKQLASRRAAQRL